MQQLVASNQGQLNTSLLHKNMKNKEKLSIEAKQLCIYYEDYVVKNNNKLSIRAKYLKHKNCKWQKEIKKKNYMNNRNKNELTIGAK